MYAVSPLLLSSRITAEAYDEGLPMSLHIDAMPDDPTLQAVMYGPLVLAGKLGPEPTRAGPTSPRMTPDFDAVSPIKAVTLHYTLSRFGSTMRSRSIS